MLNTILGTPSRYVQERIFCTADTPCPMLDGMAATSTAGSGARYRDALRVPEFRALFGAFALSLTGSVVSAVALMVLVYERTGSSLLASLTFASASCRISSRARCSRRSSTASLCADCSPAAIWRARPSSP